MEEKAFIWDSEHGNRGETMELTQEEYRAIILDIEELKKQVAELLEKSAETGVIITGAPKFIREHLDKQKRNDK